MESQMDERLRTAMWEGDVATLEELAPCGCCCAEHTFGPGCPAYQWGGCRGQGVGDERAEEESWKRHYMAEHGMTEAQFYGISEEEWKRIYGDQ